MTPVSARRLAESESRAEARSLRTEVPMMVFPAKFSELNALELSDEARLILTRIIRVAFPHPDFPDGPYERMAQKIIDASEESRWFRMALTQGLVTLDSMSDGHFLDLPEDRALAVLKRVADLEFFGFIRRTTVLNLYDDPEVQATLGYEGESFSKGGYLHRGFNDLAWLPDPSDRRERGTGDGDRAVALHRRSGRPRGRGQVRAGSVQGHGHRRRRKQAMSTQEISASIDHEDDSAVVIVGSGAGGGTLAHELVEKGIKVVLLEAGPYLKNEDYEQDEWAAFNQMAWLDPRTTSGSFRLARDFPNLPAWLVKAVGGTTTHWSGATPRFKAHEFKARSTYGRIDGANLLDWPITLSDLEPYYERAEMKMGSTHRHGRAPLPANNNYKVLANGAERLGYRHYATGPYATNAEPYDGRPASIQDGFNFQGDKHGSKWSIMVSEIPKSLRTGLLDLRPESQAVQITHNPEGRVDGVLYSDAEGNLHRQKARIVAVAGNAIETPRLLFLSASPLFPDGLANSSGQLGRNYMRHTTGSVYAQFDEPVHMYRGETMAGLIADESRHDVDRGFAGGYYMETISLGPAFLASFADPGAWGPDFTALLDGYRNTAGLWVVGEDMPQESNRVSLNTTVTDRLGLPVPNVHFDDHPNDVAMREHGYQQGSLLYEAVGSVSAHHAPPYPSTHNLGTARMSERPEDGVVNQFGQAHDVPNLFISDGSQFTTGAAANPTLTIVALAIRQAEYIADQMAASTL